MNIGWIGLGKLGYPVALAIESRGHTVNGWDVSPDVRERVEARRHFQREVGMAELIDGSAIKVRPVSELVEWSDLIFLAVQTPHEERFEGVTPMGEERRDFDYRYLVEACREIGAAAAAARRRVTLVVVSTVLPGTMERSVLPVLPPEVSLVYNPAFIAMGTTIPNFLDPEFVLVGGDGTGGADGPRESVRSFYESLHSSPIIVMDIPTAELTKVAYNTFIGFKLSFINTMAQICDATGADVDALSSALGLAKQRLLAPAYLTAGMGDGGACHPRDNIALSWLARELDLGYDLFEAVMRSREAHAAWLGRLAVEQSQGSGLPLVILGRAFKADSDIVTGSPARLVAHLIETETGTTPTIWDPVIDGGDPPAGPAVYLVATRHSAFENFPFPSGSIVVDPWGFVVAEKDVTLLRPGRRGH